MTTATLEKAPGKELEVIEAEIIPDYTEPLTKAKAKALDKKIRATGERITTGFDTLVDLLGEAMLGSIHEALEYSSWTAYVKDAVQIRVNDRAERKDYVSLMSGKGLSQRTIASILGISQKTVDRDLEGEKFDSDKVTSVDGKQVDREKPKPKKKAAEKEPEDEPPVKAAPFSTDFRDELYNLTNCVAALKDLIYEDERFEKARARLVKSKMVDDYRNLLAELDDMLGVILGDEPEPEHADTVEEQAEAEAEAASQVDEPETEGE